MSALKLTKTLLDLSQRLTDLHNQTVSALEEVENVSLELARLNPKDDQLLKFMAVLYRDVPEKFYEGNTEFITEHVKKMSNYILDIYGRKES